MNDAEVEVRMLRRQLMWDLVDHDRVYDPAVQEMLGYSPASEEVLDAEHEEADQRADGVLPHICRITLLASVAATVVSKSHLMDFLTGECDEEKLLAILTAIISTGSSAVLSDLLAGGHVVDPAAMTSEGTR